MNIKYYLLPIFLALSLTACDNNPSSVLSDLPKYKTGQARGWQTPHFGQIRKGNGYSFEGVPVAGDNGSFTLYVYDDKLKPIDLSSSSGAKGALMTGTRPVACEMQKVDTNAYSCKAAFTDEVNLKALVYLGLPSGDIAKIDFDFLMDAKPDEILEGVVK